MQKTYGLFISCLKYSSSTVELKLRVLTKVTRMALLSSVHAMLKCLPNNSDRRFINNIRSVKPRKTKHKKRLFSFQYNFYNCLTKALNNIKMFSVFP